MASLIELTTDQCFELLNTGLIGRVVFRAPMGLRVVPVNYAMYGASIVWRTAPYSELGSYGDGREAVFEVDHIDYEQHRAWSVLATGKMQLVDDPDDVTDIRLIEDPVPWADGSRHLYMRLDWYELSGRRIGENRRDPRLTVPPEAFALGALR